MGGFRHLKILTVMIALVAFVLRARACVETDGSSDSQYIGLGLSGTNFSVFIPIDNAFGGSFCSGVCLTSNWVLTAAHPFTDSSGNVNGTAAGILLGAPFTASSPLAPVKASYIYPGFNNSGNGPDLMLIQLASPLNVPSLTIGTANPGDMVTTYGYGEYGTPSGGLNYADGNLRAFQANVDSLSVGGYSSTYYQADDFGFYLQGVSLNGRVAFGDSGGPVFNSRGQLVGITEFASVGLSPVGNSGYNNLSQPDVANWIQQTITPVAAEILSVTATNADVQLAWSGKGGTNYVVQAASALGGTNTFSDISGVIALPGVGPVPTNFLDSGALTNFHARFYRIRTN